MTSITHYIGYYEDCISEDDCDKIMSHNWRMQKSTYANNKGKLNQAMNVLKWMKCGLSKTCHFMKI